MQIVVFPKIVFCLMSTSLHIYATLIESLADILKANYSTIVSCIGILVINVHGIFYKG